MRKTAPLIVGLLFAPIAGHAQAWMELMQDPAVNVHDVQAAFHAHWDGRPYERSKGFKMFKRWEWWKKPRSNRPRNTCGAKKG